jgi:hypothetical protein
MGMWTFIFPASKMEHADFSNSPRVISRTLTLADSGDYSVIEVAIEAPSFDEACEALKTCVDWATSQPEIAAAVS